MSAPGRAFISSFHDAVVNELNAAHVQPRVAALAINNWTRRESSRAT